MIYRTGTNPSGTINAVKAEVRDPVLDLALGKDGEEKRVMLEALKITLEGAMYVNLWRAFEACADAWR